jgi:peptidoglycan biosynthesis protein MviN/MurJ (putative lipid II flippase)
MSPITQSLLYATNKTWAVFYLDLFSIILNVTFSYFLINRFGLTGIGIADLLSNVIFFLVEIIYLQKSMNLDIQKLGKAFLLSTIFIFVSYCLMTLHKGITLLIEGIILLIILLILEYFILTSEEKDIFKTLLSKFLFKYIKKPYSKSESF